MILISNSSPYARPALLAAALCLALFITASLSRPLFPVDETRYLTVAWEMHGSGNWILPTLNHEAYHHKPPVLFWLINMVWAIFGVSQEGAMAVPYLAAFAFLMLTARLATRLFPRQKDAPLLATALLAGSLPFVIYSNLIMFDLLLGVFALIGITAIWDYMTTRHPVHLLPLALAVGLGTLTKGPVILLHLAPALLLVRFWLPPQQNPPRLLSTIPSIAATIVTGAVLALLWAIPAAIEGGKEFADKIFWGQTAGRMVKAFDHARPVYWYLMFVPLFLLPWLASPTLWSGAKSLLKSKDTPDKTVKRFLALWGIPVFIAFSLISGKQVHYLAPLLPCIALFLTAATLKTDNALKKRDFWPVLTLTIILTLVPIVMHQAASHIESLMGSTYHLEDPFSATNPIPSLVIAVIIAAMGFPALRSKTLAITTIAVSMVLMMCGFQLAAKTGFFTEYDLTPMAAELQKYEDRPIAFMNNYQGEYGFLAHRNKPIEQVNQADLPSWFRNHPDGLAIFRTKNEKDFANYHVLFTMPYRMTTTYALVEAPK
ncbi:MAG TPA: glycosyltransferase family 39 protein [Alphaproteobacteria bacterium]|nr:glycosyltransferase family 39 protein [Alphaproteobacteria bacterium]HNS44925.1 glycosyltransferase family 39 protein [Alphaproteobacteria bacterium]